MAAIHTHEFCLSYDVAFHGFENVRFLGVLGKVEPDVEGVEFEKVAVRAVGGTGAAVAQLWPGVFSGSADGAPFEDSANIGRDVM